MTQSGRQTGGSEVNAGKDRWALCCGRKIEVMQEWYRQEWRTWHACRTWGQHVHGTRASKIRQAANREEWVVQGLLLLLAVCPVEFEGTVRLECALLAQAGGKHESVGRHTRALHTRAAKERCASAGNLLQFDNQVACCIAALISVQRNKRRLVIRVDGCGRRGGEE